MGCHHLPSYNATRLRNNPLLRSPPPSEVARIGAAKLGDKPYLTYSRLSKHGIIIFKKVGSKNVFVCFVQGRTARGAPPPSRSAPPPAPVRHAHPPAPVSGGGGSIAGGLGATIAQGMAFGTGSAMAHRAVDGLIGPRTVTHEYVTPDAPGSSSLATVSGSDTCLNQAKSFQDCINAYGSVIGKCQFYIDMLNECRRGPSSSIKINFLWISRYV
ncbi:hypothetical protein L7F22_006536 [Adiantum nelumboides]|nr:hypothetical protein [Adiantum nelumboides]